jgi:hypothetical protein
VRFPVMMTRLMFEAAIGRTPFGGERRRVSQLFDARRV